MKSTPENFDFEPNGHGELIGPCQETLAGIVATVQNLSNYNRTQTLAALKREVIVIQTFIENPDSGLVYMVNYYGAVEADLVASISAVHWPAGEKPGIGKDYIIKEIPDGLTIDCSIQDTNRTLMPVDSDDFENAVFEATEPQAEDQQKIFEEEAVLGLHIMNELDATQLAGALLRLEPCDDRSR